MTWTAIADTARAEIYFVDNDYVLSGYVLETWPIEVDKTEAWQATASASTTWT